MDDSGLILSNKLTRIVCAKCGRRLDVSSIRPLAEVACPECGQHMPVPVALGQFHLLKEIGAGGMGAVYEAVDTTLGRHVAIKVMKRTSGAEREMVESFLREARTAASLNHRNVVQIYACGETSGQPYIVMELMTHGRLDQLMGQSKQMDEVRLLEVAMDVSEGLRAAHELGLVHGDIKPANILFDGKGAAKIADFGLAQFVNRQQGTGVWGTPFYISPERARGGRADHRSDVYSLGASLFHALTGLPPFDGPTPTDVVLARLKTPPPQIREFRPDLQKATSDLIMRMLEADPAVRYPTSASLQADLREALQASREARKHPKRAAAEAAGKGPAKFPVGGLIAGVVVLVAAAVAGFLLWGGGKKPAPVGPGPVAPVPGPVTPGPAPGPELSATDQVFDANESLYLVRAGAAMAAGSTMSPFEQLSRLKEKVPANSGRAMWVTTLQGMARMAAGDRADGERRLAEVTRIKIAVDPASPIHAPQVLARYALGEIGRDEMLKRGAGWPAWYPAMGSLVGGVGAAARGDLKKARDDWSTFNARPEAMPAWVAAFRDAVAKWMASVNTVAEAIAAKDAASLQALRSTAPTVFHPAIATALGVSMPAAAVTSPPKPVTSTGPVTSPPKPGQGAGAPVPRPAGRGETASQMEAREEANVNDLIEYCKSEIVARKDFISAVAAMDRMIGTLKSAPVRSRAMVERENFQRMRAMRDFVVKNIAAVPYRPAAGSDLGGSVVGADGSGIKLDLGGGRTEMRRWDQVSHDSVVKLAEHCVRNAPAPAGERSLRAVGLAIYAGLALSADARKQYLQLAVQIDGGAADEIRRAELPMP